jgi:hypothetical protein
MAVLAGQIVGVLVLYTLDKILIELKNNILK